MVPFKIMEQKGFPMISIGRVDCLVLLLELYEWIIEAF